MAGPIGSNFGSRLPIHLGMDRHRLNPSLPSILQGVLGGGGGRGSHIQKSWEAVKRLDRLSPTLVHVCGFIWEWT